MSIAGHRGLGTFHERGDGFSAYFTDDQRSTDKFSLEYWIRWLR